MKTDCPEACGQHFRATERTRQPSRTRKSLGNSVRNHLMSIHSLYRKRQVAVLVARALEAAR